MVHEQDCEMLDLREKIFFKVSSKSQAHQVKEIKHCGKCFSELVLSQRFIVPKKFIMFKTETVDTIYKNSF